MKDQKKKKTEKNSVLMASDMSDKDMNDLLLELKDTSFYQAIIRLTRIKDNDILTSLAALDPFKEPTKVARSQGMRSGIYNIESMVSLLSEQANNAENDQ